MIFPIPFLAVALAAQSVAPLDRADQPIIITGQPDTRQAVQQFVRSLTPTLWRGQISRFEHTVCPGVYGLAPQQARAVLDRMRAVTKSVGIAVDREPCYPNVVLIATYDKKILLEQLERHRGEIFGELGSGDIRAMERDPEPAVAWQLRGAPITALGMDVYFDDHLGWVNKTTDAGSHITEIVRPQFDASVVVVEKRALVGLTVTQLADYAIIRALTGANPEKLGNSGAPTILHVLDVPVGGEAPVTMTQWDFAFLRGFYDVRRYLRAGAQRSAIANDVAKTVQAPQQGQPQP